MSDLHVAFVSRSFLGSHWDLEYRALRDFDNATEIARQERATNALLYGLYGLGAEEIKMAKKG
jgi:hypothetical protein